MIPREYRAAAAVLQRECDMPAADAERIAAMIIEAIEPKLTGRHECDNCNEVFEEGELDEIRKYSERVAPGGTVPSGQCPSCGCLCFPEEAA